MANCMNKVFISGNVTREPNIISGDWGKMASFSVSVSESYKDKNGEWQVRTQFPNCKASGKWAEAIHRIHKGDHVKVEGQIETGSYINKNGVKVYTTDIRVQNMLLISTAQEREANKNGVSSQQQSMLSDGLESIGAEVLYQEQGSAVPF